MSSVKPRRISDIKPLFTNLAQTSNYQLTFGGLPFQLSSYLARRGVDITFIASNAGLLCYNASLPTTNFSPKQIDGNFTGIQEKFATARLYNDISLDFYVDNNYKMIKFLESWMEFIASGSHHTPIGNFATISQAENNYFVRMQYPESYKCNFSKIVKFDRDYKSEIEYTFIGLWPSMMSSPTISYESNDALKVSVTFSYDRYIAGRPLGINFYNGDAVNIESNRTDSPAGPTPDRLVPISPGSAGAGGVRFVRQSATPFERANQQFFDIGGTRPAP